MNKRSVKLLEKYAPHTDMDTKALKIWWTTLNWQEKTAQRIKIEAIVAAAEGEAEEATDNE